MKLYRFLKCNFTHTLVLAIMLTICCAKIKLYAGNRRTGGVIYSQPVRTLLECSTLYEKSHSSLSFNYDPGTKTCELSVNYPENFTMIAIGWSVYSRMVDGAWTAWVSWGNCPYQCTTVYRVRLRSCTNPAPSNGGEDCPGTSSEQSTCYFCPTNGDWNDWSNWSACSVTCGYGTKYRSRLCSNPPPRDGGAECVGENSSSSTCMESLCLVAKVSKMVSRKYEEHLNQIMPANKHFLKT